MKTVGDVIKAKGGHVSWIAPNATVYDALKFMSEIDIGALPVMEGEKIVGILSERDYARKIALHGKSSKETLVKEIMITKVMFIKPSNTLEECMAVMTEKRIRHFPVIADNKLIGIISMGDVVKAIIAEQHFTINNLINYILSG